MPETPTLPAIAAAEAAVLAHLQSVLDPEIRRTYEKLGIPIEEQKVLAGVEGARKVAVDAVFDSVSVATTFRRIRRIGKPV